MSVGSGALTKSQVLKGAGNCLRGSVILSGFINSILTQGEPDVPAQDVINSMTVSLAIEQSLVSGQPQKVAYFNLRQP